MRVEAETIVRSIRARYDGYKRDPYNEFEYGGHYARSMASYGLSLAYSGFTYDAPKRQIGFFPQDKNSVYFWSVCRAWGTVKITEQNATLKVLYGELTLSRFSCGAFAGRGVTRNGVLLVKDTDDTVIFENHTVMKAGKQISFDIIPLYAKTAALRK
ncbi:hypothetical protein FACS1894211_16230 [Clostridia bacterium]|nr:hypothetical protein FACS1894211_16230 [Clostridia bacterium]